MTQPVDLWVVNPDDPRAPPQEVWDRMTEAERLAVVDQLPSEFPVSESNPPEGDRHWNALADTRQTLTRWFRKGGRRIYVSGNLPVYYPGESMFSPDVIAVLDVEPHERESWIVSRENNRGLDFALEIIVSGRRRKDLKDNVRRYARLGIGEYFVFDVTRKHMVAYRLPAPAATAYEAIVPQGGRYPSRVLGLDLYLDAGRLAFAANDASVLNADQLISKLEQLMDDGERRYAELEAQLEEEQKRREEEQKRREEEQKRREEEQKRREEEQKRREEAEAEVALLRAELEALTKRKNKEG